MGKTVILSAIINPQVDGQWTFHPNGVLVIKDGRIVSIGSVADCSATFGSDAEIVQLDGVIIPGFVDVHCHWVQHAVRGAYSGDLLHWLQNNIWPEEARYADETVARERAREFYRDMLRAGTVMGMSYSSVHRQATEIALDEMRGDWVVGNVLMAVNAPDALTQCSVHQESALREFARLKPQERYAVTPRFAPNMRDDDLAAAARVAREGDFLVQTHLAESQSEIAWVKELFPDAANYTEVYDRAGLLGPKSILGHCIEMSDAEWACLASRGSWVAHCPTSNEALGNTRMPLEKLQEYRIPYALASDIGAGPSHSMLHVIQRFLAVHYAAGVPVTASEALYRATLAGAQAMGRGELAGNFVVGKRADFVLMPGKPKATELEGWFVDLCQGSIAELEERPLAVYLAGKEVSRVNGSGMESASVGLMESAKTTPRTNSGAGMQ